MQNFQKRNPPSDHEKRRVALGRMLSWAVEEAQDLGQDKVATNLKRAVERLQAKVQKPDRRC